MNLRILIPVALISIGIGVYGLSEQIFQKNNVPEAASQVVNQESRVSVYKVIKPIGQGVLITKTHLAVERLPENEALQLGIDPEQPLSLSAGSVANQALEAGDIISPAMILTPNEAGYIDAVIEPIECLTLFW